MSVAIVVGAQWGDEGKGKVVDLFSERADVVVRYGGGANAGHTLVVNGKPLVTHLIPSGVLHPGKLCVLGDGMVIDPDALLQEIADCKERGLLRGSELVISSRAHLILPYHKEVEAIREATAFAIGTTKRGIGPAYESKSARRGIRMIDLSSPSLVRERMQQNLADWAPFFAAAGKSVPDQSTVDAWLEKANMWAEKLLPHVQNAGQLLDKHIRAGQHVLFEGAQGSLLDLDQGTYPFVTSSTTIAGGACQGTGVGPTKIDRVVGITKAYCTRVGNGPFPTEMPTDVAERWRKAGGEFGATTGRPRRCGYLDLAALRLAIRINGMDSLAITKLDVLSGQGPIKVCVGYKAKGTTFEELPLELLELGTEITPIVEELPGWKDTIRSARVEEDLPKQARTFLQFVAERLETRISLVSVGPERGETIVLERLFG